MKRPQAIRSASLLIMKLSVSFGILYWVFSHISFSGVLETLLAAHPWILAAAFAVMIVNHWTNSLKTHILTRRQGLTLTVHDIFRVSAVTSFYKLVLPGGMGGGVIRWYKLARPDGKPLEAFNVIMYDRVIGTISMALLGIGFAALDPLFRENSYVWPSALVLLLALVAPIVFYILAFNGRWSRWIYAHLPRFVPDIIRGRLHQLADSADRFSGWGSGLLVRIWFWAFVSRFLTLYFCYLFAVSIDMDISLATVGWIWTVVYLLTLIPVSISGLGVREASLLLLLVPYGIDAESTVAFSMLSFIAILIMGAWGGLYELWNLFKPGTIDVPQSSHNSC